MIAESGGVQEISLAKSEGYLTPKEKLKEARALVLATALATVSGDQIAAQNNPEKKGAGSSRCDLGFFHHLSLSF